jgi:hypothetical protein
MLRNEAKTLETHPWHIFPFSRLAAKVQSEIDPLTMIFRPMNRGNKSALPPR